MASDLRVKTQNAIDALRNDNAACSLAMLIDGDTGLVLCKSSETVVPQDQLDELATGSQGRRENALAAAMITASTKPEFLSWIQVEKDSITAVISPVENSDDALVCRFDAMPDRSELLESARAIFDLTNEAEAA